MSGSGRHGRAFAISCHHRAAAKRRDPVIHRFREMDCKIRGWRLSHWMDRRVTALRAGPAMTTVGYKT
jgi:hypothetical protein